MSFTQGQQGKYRPLVKRAWIAHCAATGTSPNSKAEKDKWYLHELHDAAGVKSTKDASQTKGFDAIMLHFAIIADDEHWISRCTRGDEGRMIYQIKRFMTDLEFLTSKPVTWDYVMAIHSQSTRVNVPSVPASIMDCTAPMLRCLLAMLDSHIRRICDDYGIAPCELPSRSKPASKPIPINPDAKYIRVGHDLDASHVQAAKSFP